MNEKNSDPSANPTEHKNRHLAKLEEIHDKEHLQKSRISEFSNVVFDNISPIGETHVISGVWARIFTFCILVLPLFLFAILLWVFVNQDCTSNNLMVSGLPANSQFAQSFTLQSSIKLCCSAGYFTAVSANDDAEGWNCCTVSGGGPQVLSDSVCSDFQQLCNSCSNTKQSPDCFQENLFMEVQISYAECIPVSTAIANALQYSWYMALLVCLVYLAFRVRLRFGIRGLCSAKNWKNVFHNVEEVKRAKSGAFEMPTIGNPLSTAPSPLPDSKQLAEQDP